MGAPPAAGSLLQAGVAIVLVWTHGLRDAVQGASLVLMLFTGLTALCVFAIRLRPELPNPPVHTLVIAGGYALAMPLNTLRCLPSPTSRVRRNNLVEPGTG